ncbi:MAG: DUF5329 domain-containing protein [Steroidobacter sp.]
MIRLAAAFLFCIAALAHADDTSSLESRKINYLISSIESLPNAQFVRNGTAYDAKAAADHLRLKWKNAGSKVSTADDFIRLCGSVSSMTGKPYLIRFADGKTVTSQSFLRDQLAHYIDKNNSKP